MNDEKMRQLIHTGIDRHCATLTSDPHRVQRVLNMAHETQGTGGIVVKKKLSIGFVMLLVFIFMSLTALAVTLLTGTQIVEQFAVPMAQENDTATYTQESYTHEELVRLIKTLNENGFSMEEDSNIMRALQNGKGYWEEEVLMAICREAFGGNFSTWSIEEKHWFDNMTVQIGFKEKNSYRIPGEGDMTLPEAKAHAVMLLNAEYGVELPVESNDQWMIWEWFYESWTDSSGFHPAMWKFEYINPASYEVEYWVTFDQKGTLLGSEMAWFLKEDAKAHTFSHAQEMMDMKYGSLANWPLEAWAEFGQLIADLEPLEAWEYRYAKAGYCLPPEGGIQPLQALGIAQENVGLKGKTASQVICCTSNGHAIYKVTLKIHLPGNETSTTYDAIWCVELDCMTGEIIDKREYRYGSSEAMLMYVPFTVLDAYSKETVAPTEKETARITEKERQADAYDAYKQQYGENWFFWPLEVQNDALGGHHHVPGQGEMTRDEAVDMALQAIEAQYGKEALTQLGDYQIGVICCRYEEPEGTRFSWELYITSDPEFLSNGFRVNIVVFEGVLDQPEVEVQRANSENG